ncbi:AbrB/MazE/SpoVT family DNA-binding domain-containing protein [Dehalococcoidia bacterium]|nr:AbrB/MazE/SpoVT family DNA-binding domain-containing protein [Dehalococcoidia bacterium]MCL0080028.1 AbrB/MazE/SpoVT family DNA-binding domain-containing protein [Dehalococcoidia bacterium]
MESITLQMAQRGVITIPKSLRESYGMQPGDTFVLLDLGGVLVLSPQRSQIDAIADEIASQWAEDGQTLEGMLQALREERDRRGR